MDPVGTTLMLISAVADLALAVRSALEESYAFAFMCLVEAGAFVLLARGRLSPTGRHWAWLFISASNAAYWHHRSVTLVAALWVAGFVWHGVALHLSAGAEGRSA